MLYLIYSTLLGGHLLRLGDHHHGGRGGHDAGSLTLLDLASQAAGDAHAAENRGGAAVDLLLDAVGGGSLLRREKRRGTIIRGEEDLMKK